LNKSIQGYLIHALNTACTVYSVLFFETSDS